MKVTELALSGARLLEPRVFRDDRGWSMESFSSKTFREAGIQDTFVLRYESYNTCAGTLRGIHFQDGPAVQRKIVQCVKGSLWDVAVDLRKDSPTYGRWVSVELSEQNGNMLYLPVGFGHGFVALEDGTRVVYLLDQVFDPDYAKTVKWNDISLAIAWPVTTPVLSEKDRCAPALEQCEISF